MEEQLENIFIFRITPAEALTNLAVALICGILISLFYRVTYKGVSYSSHYVISIIMLAMITALVIMVIGNNLARAFGLVGAMSIIRFRTAVKDTQDIMYIFFALAAGLACGAGMYAIAVTGTLFIGFSLMIASAVYAENPAKREYLLQIVHLGSKVEKGLFNRTIEKYVTRYNLVNVKNLTDDRGDIMEFSYYIMLKKDSRAPKLLAELREIPNVDKVNLFFDEE
ncbi:MAG: DUF4956 domain-containing protein [Saprospirales bacterium]|nr:MAG: DUF4956 domain-containing protein [Saprospirales bacterium]